MKIIWKFTPKLSDRGAQCMMVGYAEQHDGDVYRMWNPLTRKIHVTRDVIWLKQMLFKKMVDEEAAIPGAELGVEINLVESNQDNDDEEIEQETEGNEDAEQKMHDENLGSNPDESDSESLETEGNSDEEEENDDKCWTTTTRSGRRPRPPAHFRTEMLQQ